MSLLGPLLPLALLPRTKLSVFALDFMLSVRVFVVEFGLKVGGGQPSRGNLYESAETLPPADAATTVEFVSADSTEYMSLPG